MILCKNYDNTNLYVIDSFHNSKKIANSPELKKYFKSISWFKTKKEAFFSAAVQNPDSIFIDSDVGVKNFIALCQLKIRSVRTEINVYEEGLGTYRTDLVTNVIKKKISSIFGIGCNFGGCFLTKNVHVFDPSRYCDRIPSFKKKSIGINVNFSIWLHENKNKLVEVFSPGFEIISSRDTKLAFLYLSDWNVNISLINKAKSLGCLFVKLHPHIKSDFHLESVDEYMIIPKSLPAEVLIILILEKFDILTVYHNNSSCIHYIKNERIISDEIIKI